MAHPTSPFIIFELYNPFLNYKNIRRSTDFEALKFGKGLSGRRYSGSLSTKIWSLLLPIKKRRERNQARDMVLQFTSNFHALFFSE